MKTIKTVSPLSSNSDAATQSLLGLGALAAELRSQGFSVERSADRKLKRALEVANNRIERCKRLSYNSRVRPETEIQNARVQDTQRVARNVGLLVRLTQRGRAEVRVLRILATAGERDLAGMAPQVVAAAGQHDRRLAAGVQEQRDEHGRVGAAVDVERGGFLGIEEDAFEQCAQVSARA